MNAITKTSAQASTLALSEADAIAVLQNSLYPGARPESIRMVLAWCKATGRDPMKRPIHIVPMWVKDAVTGQGGMRDVLMPGIGTYRTDAANSGQYAGKGEPEFGPDVTGAVGNLKITYPKWCKVTVSRLVGGQIRHFTAMEFWLENYATAGRDKDEPNTMWRKRPYGQLAKCAESQALRMAFPDETGNTNTQEEMEGKTFDGVTLDHRAEPGAPLNDAIPERVMAAPAPKPSVMERIDSIRAELAAAPDEAAVTTIGGSPRVLTALSWLRAGGDERKSALDELEAVLNEAYRRVKETPHDPDTGEVTEPEFPGDR